MNIRYELTMIDRISLKWLEILLAVTFFIGPVCKRAIASDLSIHQHDILKRIATDQLFTQLWESRVTQMTLLKYNLFCESPQSLEDWLYSTDQLDDRW